MKGEAQWVGKALIMWVSVYLNRFGLISPFALLEFTVTIQREKRVD